MFVRWRSSVAALLLIPLLTAAAPTPAEIASQLAVLAFDPNAASDIPARTVLGRWTGPMRLFVFGRPVDQEDAAQALRSVSRATRLPMAVVRQDQVLSMPPNAFVVADADLVGGFRGPLLPMLRNAMGGNDAAIEDFIAGVISIQSCWVLPVWTDAGQTELKAAIIGIDIRQKRASIQHCMLRELAASVGLMGDGGVLPRSVFNPKLEARWLSREDAAMLRVLYGPALRPGMTRQEVAAAAQEALRVKSRPQPVPAIPAQ